MALDIDALVQKSITLTTTTGQAATIPQLWRAELEPNLRKRAVWQQSLLENTDLVGTAGDGVFIPTLPDLAAAGALTEATDMNVIALNNSDSVEFKPSEVGIAVGITRKALDRIKYDAIAAIVDRLAYSMSLYIETTISNLYSGSVPGHAGQTVAVYRPNGKIATTMAATDTLSSKAILESVAQLEATNNVPFDDGFWRMYIAPHQYVSLMEDADVRNDLRYASPETILRGEIGVLHNVRIIKTNYIPNVTENTITTYNAMLVSPRWAAIAWKRRPETVVDPTLYDFGRRRQFAVMADLDIELLHNDRCLSVRTA